MREILFIWAVLLGVLFAYNAKAQNTVMDMNYKGQPVPSAIAPSMSAFSQDVCGIPVSGAISSTVIGVSGGTVYTDKNCERIKIAKTLNDLGLKVAAVSVLCDDIRVWEGMLQSGTPCPVSGLIGDAAYNQWLKLHPERFQKLYGFIPPTLSAIPAGFK